jgi:glycosyltransferase involved in cell wall biosynthesis
MTPELTVVVPFFNEEAVAYGVVDELCRQLERMAGAWEVVLVDDGSGDRTDAELERARSAWPQCRLLRFPANRGQGAALFAGIREARAPVIGMMDGDGQNVPANLAVLLAALAEADLVVGVRRPRRDSPIRRWISRLANAVRGRLLGDRLSDAGCALKVFRREVADAFIPLDMLNPFMPAMAAASGFRVAERPVEHRERKAGCSKYGVRAMALRPLADFWTVWRLVRRRRQTSKSAPA